MLKIRKFSSWKFALGIAWIFVLTLLGITVAEISQYGSIVQFLGESLEFSWLAEGDPHHYRVQLTVQDMTNAESAGLCSTLYSEEAAIKVETSPGLAYQMRVQAIRANGDISPTSESSKTYLCLGGAGSGGSGPMASLYLPAETTLGPNYPNPFNSTTTIPFALAAQNGKSVAITLHVYNTLGQLVRTLIDENRLPGQYRVIWDGRNDSGVSISAGTYICLLKADEYVAQRTIVYLK